MNSFNTEKLSSIFADALTGVISKMAGFSFDILSSDADNNFEEITSVMNLNGMNHGIIFISAKEKVMRIISSFMTGIPENEITRDDIEDTLCELVNMTAGNAKLRTNNTEHTFTLSQPFIINGENLSIKAKKRINIFSRILGNNEISIKLKLIFFT